MPTRTKAGLWLACLLMLPLHAHAQELSDAQLVEMIVRDGAQARAIRATAEVARHEQDARTVFPNPGVAYSREGAGVTQFFQVEQALPVFGSRKALAHAGAAAIAAAEAERDARLWQLRADAQTLVARLLAEQDKLDAARATVREIERIIALLRIREQEGEGSRFDRLRAEQELGDAQQIALDAAAAAAEARASITAALTEGTRVTRVPGTLYVQRDVPSPEALQARAAATRSDLKALRSESDRFRLEADAAKRTRLPAPTLVGGVKRVEFAGGHDSGGVFGINITVPLFDSGERESSRWVAEQARIDAERSFVAQYINAQVTAAMEVVALRQDAVRALDARAPADELTRIAEVGYTEGEVRILEFLDAHRTAARARMRAIDMRLAARLAQIALERAVGEPLWP